MNVRPRIIPCLLISDEALVKTVKFDNAVYVGDPINTVHIFNEKCADELILLDIDATICGHGPNFKSLQEIISECFMPVSYGGGITSVEQALTLIKLGVEKIILNSHVFNNYGLITEIASVLGSQAVVGSVDVKRDENGSFEIFSHSFSVKQNISFHSHIETLISAGVGEIFLNSIDNDGLMCGYDLELVELAHKLSPVPVVICGGAGNLRDMQQVTDFDGMAAAAGSVFIYHGKKKAVLINYPGSI